MVQENTKRKKVNAEVHEQNKKNKVNAKAKQDKPAAGKGKS